MIRECARCGETFTAGHNFRYCVHCEAKVQELSELWINTTDDLLGELRVALRDMFDELDETLAYAPYTTTPRILEAAFKRIPRSGFYERQLCQIHSEFAEPTNEEWANRDEERKAQHDDLKTMEALGK